MELYANRTGWFILKLTQSFYFEAAHTLAGRYTDIHTKMQSENIHGHTYVASISVEGEPDENGMVKDFNHFKWAIEPLKLQIDHKFLNNVEGLGLPTMENLCLFIADFLKSFKGLCEVTVERKASGDKCTYQIKKEKNE
jgi:6-pyruvoyltetrahydropterin/6-carboxytetrahydropterin synthase